MYVTARMLFDLKWILIRTCEDETLSQNVFKSTLNTYCLLFIISMSYYTWPIPVAARLLTLWVRIPPGAWMFVWYEYCVLSGRGLCDELITWPGELYGLWCDVMCYLETSRMRRAWPSLGSAHREKQTWLKDISNNDYTQSSLASGPPHTVDE